MAGSRDGHVLNLKRKSRRESSRNIIDFYFTIVEEYIKQRAEFAGRSGLDEEQAGPAHVSRNEDVGVVPAVSLEESPRKRYDED